MVQPVILIVGGTGVFGSRLAAWLIRQGGHDIVVAGREAARGAAFCGRHGGRFAVIDRNAPATPAAVAAYRAASKARYRSRWSSGSSRVSWRSATASTKTDQLGWSFMG